MTGGLLNLVAYGNQNILLTGNPSKTFFKTSYSKYTNFGLQKFRIDFDGLRTLRMNEVSKFRFKIPRYADLLMDTYLVVNLPTIWSSILNYNDTTDPSFIAYEFKWIKNIGTQMIKEVVYSVGGHIIQKYTGSYIQNMVERDFTRDKKDLFDEMTGNIPELNDPETYFGGTYPTCTLKSTSSGLNPNEIGPEPSIRGKTLYIPLNNWFSLSSKMAFPLVSLQYNELYIDITLRPIRELFVIRDVRNIPNDYNYNSDDGIKYLPEYIQANQNETEYKFYMFVQPPIYDASNNIKNKISEYPDKRTDWNADIHLMSTYCFLSNDEVRVFASRPQNYLIKNIYEYNYKNIVGSQKIKLNTMGMVSNWMWYFQRDDIALRNEWGNYTNWKYDILPNTFNPDKIGEIYITNGYNPENNKNILVNLGILCDGLYREKVWPAGIYNKIEKYTRTNGGSKNNNSEGLYCYNFCFNTNPFDLQPNGAFNASKFSNIEFEFTTAEPLKDASAQVNIICDPSGDILSIEKPVWGIYKYSYDLTIQEERYNILKFIGGNASLMYAL